MTAPEYDAMTYEQLIATLEQLIEQMSSGEIGIEEATALYERANLVHDLAAARLEAVRTRIDRLAPGSAPPAGGVGPPG